MIDTRNVEVVSYTKSQCTKLYSWNEENRSYDSCNYVEKAFKPLLLKKFKIRNKKELHQLDTKGICGKLTENIIFNGKTMKHFHQR